MHLALKKACSFYPISEVLSETLVGPLVRRQVTVDRLLWNEQKRQILGPHRVSIKFSDQMLCLDFCSEPSFNSMNI